jgi:hypothetical protein
MSGRHFPQPEHALQQSVILFGKLLFQLDEPCLTNTYQVDFWVFERDNIDYLVLRFLNTCTPPFEEWAEVLRRGHVVFLYIGDGLWRRFNLGFSCVKVQEVES